jgi:aryl-alcohol dehydrogenase
MAAMVAGCTTIIAVDVKASRLALARELGATHTLNPADVDVVDAIRQISGGGVDYSLDASGAGSPAVIGQAVESLATLGTCGLVGGAPPGMELTLQHGTLLRGRSVRGIIQGDSNPDLFIPTLIALHAQGRFPFDRLLAFYPLDEINEAAAASKEGQVVKPVIRMGPAVE